MKTTFVMLALLGFGVADAQGQIPPDLSHRHTITVQNAAQISGQITSLAQDFVENILDYTPAQRLCMTALVESAGPLISGLASLEALATTQIANGDAAGLAQTLDLMDALIAQLTALFNAMLACLGEIVPVPTPIP